MSKILYFDMWSPEGHRVFNDIHLKALSQLGEVYTIFKEGYYRFDYPHVTHFLDIPQSFYKSGEGYYKSRLRLARMLRWVWKSVSKEKWDYIILSSYDPLSLYLSRRLKNAIVVDHNTIGLLDSKILGFPLRHLSRGIKHIVFNDYMKKRMIEMGIENVTIVPHGFLPMEVGTLSKEEEKEIRGKYCLDASDKIVFLPSLSKSTNDLFGQMLYNDNFNDFLKQHGLKMITKSKVKRNSMSNMIIINGYLPEKDYQYLFLHSSCNVLLYSEDFKYRSSGVLNECFANKIPCIISDCPSLKEYLPYIDNVHCVFQSADEIKRSILSAIGRDKKDYFNNLEKIENPQMAWTKILK